MQIDYTERKCSNLTNRNEENILNEMDEEKIQNAKPDKI